MPNNDDVLAGAKATLAKANNLTTTVEGSPTSHFAPPATPTHITGVKSAPAHELSHTPYSMASELKAKTDNVGQYKDSTE